MRTVTVLGPRTKKAEYAEVTCRIINTTSSSGEFKGLSPFVIGPCRVKLSHGVVTSSTTMENAWQFAKLYPKFADKHGEPTPAYWEWARRGWSLSRAVRYPMGKGAVPLCSLWNGKRLGYIEARKRIYIPLYRDAVAKTEAFAKLAKFLYKNEAVALWDYDGYDHDRLGMSLKEVINDPTRKMGHAFVLKMMLLYGPDFKVKDVE